MNFCKYGCGQQGIKQLRSGEWICSMFPAQCPELRKKNSESHQGKTSNWKNGHPRGATGKEPWNKGKKGLQKHSEESKEKMRRKGEGREHSQETKEKMSKTRTEMYIGGWEAVSCGRSKRHKYTSPIAGRITVDGKWELAVAKHLDTLKVKWKRNTERFPYTNLKGKASTYCPDFYVFDWSCYIEVKGYRTELDECKWSQFPKKLSIWTSDILIEKGIINRNRQVIESD